MAHPAFKPDFEFADAYANGVLTIVMSVGPGEFEAGAALVVGALKVISKKAARRALRNALIKQLGKEAAKKHAAHHIVAVGEEAAAPARAVLETLGIDLNGVANGVFLPTTKGISEATVHAGPHNAAYYNLVNEVVVAASVEGRAAVIEALGKIRAGLLSGKIALK
jgi:hypothetical protein